MTPTVHAAFGADSAPAPASDQMASGKRNGLTMTPAVARMMMLEAAAVWCGAIGKRYLGP
jgi:hypothetical protein